MSTPKIDERREDLFDRYPRNRVSAIEVAEMLRSTGRTGADRFSMWPREPGNKDVQRVRFEIE